MLARNVNTLLTIYLRGTLVNQEESGGDFCNTKKLEVSLAQTTIVAGSLVASCYAY